MAKKPPQPRQTVIPKIATDEVARLTSDGFNQRTTERHYSNEVRFSFYNHHTLMEAIKTGRAVDITKLPKRTNKAAIIIGSGPTLDEALPLLKEWRQDIICSTSHATTLLHEGIVPQHVLALDPDCGPEEMKAPIDWAETDTRLYLHPGVNPDLVGWWPGQFGVFRKLQPQTPFYAGEQAMGYSTLGELVGNRYQPKTGELLITGQIPMLACVTAAQICVGKILGYRQMFLVGCDFAYPDDVYRFTRWDWTGKRWKDSPPPPLNLLGGDPDPIIETETGLKSSTMLVFYGHQVVIAWRITETNVVNTNQKGFLRMFPYAPLEEVVKRQDKGVKAFNLKQIRRAAEEHLAKQNIYFIVVGNGILPHEFKDPLHEIPKMMAQVKTALTQQGKGDQMDLEANMRRIRRLFKLVAESKAHAS